VRGISQKKQPKHSGSPGQSVQDWPGCASNKKPRHACLNPRKCPLNETGSPEKPTDCVRQDNRASRTRFLSPLTPMPLSFHNKHVPQLKKPTEHSPAGFFKNLSSLSYRLIRPRRDLPLHAAG